MKLINLRRIEMAVTDAELKELIKAMGSHHTEAPATLAFARDQLISDKCMVKDATGTWLATEKGQRLISRMLNI
jgi:hypothetical protein